MTCSGSRPPTGFPLTSTNMSPGWRSPATRTRPLEPTLHLPPGLASHTLTTAVGQASVNHPGDVDLPGVLVPPDGGALTAGGAAHFKQAPNTTGPGPDRADGEQVLVQG